MKNLTSGASSGMSLIEVMIALVVLSIGLAGLAALHLNSVQFVHSAHYRSLASTIALDLEERLWLRVADNALVGCPDPGTEAGTAAAELIEDWNREAVSESWEWTTAPLLRIPNLSIDIGTPVVGSATVEIPVTLIWNESRFSDTEDPVEQFDYVLRVVCRPGA